MDKYIPERKFLERCIKEQRFEKDGSNNKYLWKNFGVTVENINILHKKKISQMKEKKDR